MIWSYTLWLECFAIIPQLAIISMEQFDEDDKPEPVILHYIACLGLYRIFYGITG